MSSQELAANVAGIHGAPGRAWLERLPEIVRACERRWGLTVGPALDAAYHHVAPAVRADGAPVVLKLGVPGDDELRSEADALRLADGRGAVRLLDADLGEGALLLERAQPGTPLTALVLAGEDEAATAVAAAVMSRLWRPVPERHRFATVAGWGEGFARHRAAHAGGSGPLPAGPLQRAQAIFFALCASMGEAVVLHGDLHHGNVLRSGQRAWVAIDPKGLVGEPAYEAGALLRNPWPGLLEGRDPGRVTRRRLDVLSETLGLDRGRLRDWSFAQAMLSAVWTIEDGGTGWEHAVGCAGLLDEA